MFNQKKMGYFVFISLFLLSIKLFSQTYEVENPKAKVCILYYKTKYKLEVIKKLVEKLNNENISVYSDIIKNMNKYNPYDYNVIIILSGAAMFNPYPGAVKYLKKHNYAKNIIYFCAVYAKNTAYGISIDKKKVDAITAASEIDNVKETTKKIIERVFQIIGVLQNE